MALKILVTGLGLLGNAIKNVCIYYKDYTFIFPEKYQWDLTSPKRANLMIQAYKPEIIIHTAAKVGGVKMNKEQPETLFHDNIMMTSNIIHCAAKYGVKKVIAFGSTCALDNITEEDSQKGEPYSNNYAYGYAKRMVEIHLRAAKEQHGMDYSYYIPASMYGPHDQFNLNNAHVIPSLIHKAKLAKDNNEPLKVWGDGEPTRELLFSEDMAHIILRLINVETGTVVVGSSEEVSVRKMAEEIVENMGVSGIMWEKDKPQGQLKRSKCNTSKLKTMIDFSFTKFEEGIDKTIHWFNNNYPNIRN